MPEEKDEHKGDESARSKKEDEKNKGHQRGRKREDDKKDSHRGKKRASSNEDKGSNRREEKDESPNARENRREKLKEELQQLRSNLEEISRRIEKAKPEEREHFPFVYNDLAPYSNTRTAEFLVNLPENSRNGYVSRLTAVSLCDPWVSHSMDVTVLPRIGSKPATTPRSKKKQENGSERPPKEGSTRLPSFPSVAINSGDLETKSLYFSDVPMLRRELTEKYTMNAQSKIDADYTRTRQDFYRMELDKLEEVHPMNRHNMRDVYFAYLQNTPGSKKALYECVHEAEKKLKETELKKTDDEKEVKPKTDEAEEGDKSKDDKQKGDPKKQKTADTPKKDHKEKGKGTDRGKDDKSKEKPKDARKSEQESKEKTRKKSENKAAKESPRRKESPEKKEKKKEKDDENSDDKVEKERSPKKDSLVESKSVEKDRE